MSNVGAPPPPESPPEPLPEPPPSPAPEPTLPHPPVPPHGRLPLGRLVLGAFLVVGGALWLLNSVNAIQVSWLVVLPIALIAVGLALVAGSRTGRHPGLITLGIILSVVLAIASSFDIRLQGGVGQRVERPASISSSATYRLSIGMLTIDLRTTALAPGARITASLGMGQMVVQVPSTVAATVHGRAGAGDVMVFGQDESGVGVDHTFATAARSHPTATPLVFLDLSVGLGQIQVTSEGG